jgi:hypothetical protein
VLGKVGIARVIECLGKSPGQTDALVKRAERQQSGIAGKLGRRWLDHQRRGEEG